MSRVDTVRIAVLAVALCAACNGVGHPVVAGAGGEATSTTDDGGVLDRDNDGVPDPEDCNDHHAAVYPGAPEVFDGLDNDCDGSIDEDGADEPAFHGFGYATVGGAGGVIVRVTTLADDGPGSLREAIDAQLGPTIIEFDIAGEIDLQSAINLRNPFLTINGSSAPPPGITLRQAGAEAAMIIGGTHEIIVTHLRVQGPYAGGQPLDTSTAVLAIDGDTQPGNVASDIVLDHLTILGSFGGGPDLWGEVRDVTVSYCLVARAWSGTSAAYFGGPNSFTLQRISLHHNAYINNQHDNPQLRADVRDFDFVNNVVAHWGAVSEVGGGGLRIRTEEGEPSVSANIVGNHFASADFPEWALVFGDLPGSVPGGPAEPVEQGTVVPTPNLGSLWIADNRLPAATLDRFSTVEGPLLIPTAAQVQTSPVTELPDATLLWVGVRDRDTSEQATLDEAEATFDMP